MHLIVMNSDMPTRKKSEYSRGQHPNTIYAWKLIQLKGRMGSLRSYIHILETDKVFAELIKEDILYCNIIHSITNNINLLYKLNIKDIKAHIQKQIQRYTKQIEQNDTSKP